MFRRLMSSRALGFLFGTVVVVLSGCGTENGGSARVCGGVSTDTDTDPMNCGRCGNVCSSNYSCIEGDCMIGVCKPGTVEDCYSGPDGTVGVGQCVGGQRTCVEGGIWTTCQGEVVPSGENGTACHDGVDNNCNGTVDEDEDRDGDGFTTCGGDCCDSTECSAPALVNANAFDAPGNNFDDDCNGVIDDTVLLCDQNIVSNTSDPMDFARAIDICQTATETDHKWGVISGSLTLADGTGVADPQSYSVRPSFGTGLLPQGGVNLAILSTGGAAAKNDMNPGFHAFSGYTHTAPNTSGFPADFMAANNNKLPNAPGCPEPFATTANDPVMLTLRIRVPSNAKSFRLSTNFYTAEFPEWTCSSYNDFFVVLLDSTYTGVQPNPTDKNLAFYTPMGSTTKVPVGVNLGHGNTGLFTQCINGETGCSGTSGSISTCVSTSELAGTGFDDPSSYNCDQNSVVGGATGWLITSGNVTPGEIITLRVAIWDTSDHVLDSLAVIDGFQWSLDLAQPGTIISRENPHLGPVPPELQQSRSR